MLSILYLFGVPILIGIVSAIVIARIDRGSHSWVEHAATGLRIFFGAHLVYSSYRYFFSHHISIDHPLAGPFIDSIEAMGLFPGIKALEFVIGVLLLSNRFVPLALVLEMPTTMTIFFLNTFITHTPITVVTGPVELAVNGLLLLAYFQCFKPMLVARAKFGPPGFEDNRPQSPPSKA